MPVGVVPFLSVAHIVKGVIGADHVEGCERRKQSCVILADRRRAIHLWPAVHVAHHNRWTRAEEILTSGQRDTSTVVGSLGLTTAPRCGAKTRQRASLSRTAGAGA